MFIDGQDFDYIYNHPIVVKPKVEESPKKKLKTVGIHLLFTNEQWANGAEQGASSMLYGHADSRKDCSSRSVLLFHVRYYRMKYSFAHRLAARFEIQCQFVGENQTETAIGSLFIEL